jgi:HD-like signal output (HDOD) protein
MMVGALNKFLQFLWPFSLPESAQPEVRTSQPVAVAELAHCTEQPDLEDCSDAFFAAVFSVESSLWAKPTRSEMAAIRQLVRKLQSKSYREKAVPRLPVVVPQLLRSLRNPKTTATDYANIVQQDPVVASGVLKMVNSVFYNPGNRVVDSFHRAVVILGLEGMRFALSSAVLHPIIECRSADYPKFGNSLWNHSVNCAVTCQLIAKRRGIDPFTAYLAGLVHDIGSVTLFTQFTQQYKLTSSMCAPVSCLVYLMEKEGASLSRAIAQDWNLPEEAQIALSDLDNGSDRRSQLGDTLFLANHLCEIHLLASADVISKLQAQQILDMTDAPADLFVQLDKLSSE